MEKNLEELKIELEIFLEKDPKNKEFISRALNRALNNEESYKPFFPTREEIDSIMNLSLAKLNSLTPMLSEIMKIDNSHIEQARPENVKLTYSNEFEFECLKEFLKIINK